MSNFTENIDIDALPDAVWNTLTDIGTIADWNPGLRASNATNDEVGIGATRHCIVSATQSLDEEVVHYDPRQAITFRITRSSMPFQSADIRFTLAANTSGTTVTVSPLYTLKYGLLGSLMDRLFVARMYSKGMRGLLEGLKTHVEAQGAIAEPTGEAQQLQCAASLGERQ
jgi:uncharacterized protein YndB with AHSA1/START domain